MRTEQEMLDLIINTARQDACIRAVILSGSRTNPDAPKDFFQDFDVVYMVTDMAPYQRNLVWIQRFGELMILQLPDDMGDPPPADQPGYTYLMQFMDGNRLDLTVYPLDRINDMVWEGFNQVLLDKDGVVSALIPPGSKVSLPQPPSQKQFDDCCNEFWWVCPYAAKGLWRQELPYARTMQEEYIREQLNKMLKWYVGVSTGFMGDPGKELKYVQRYLPEAWWQRLLRTYANADIEQTWQALFAMGELFRLAAQVVADHFSYAYPEEDDWRVSVHLRHVHDLPRDAIEMYA